MPDWNYQPYRGINPQLLQSMVNMPSKSASGLNALSSGLSDGFGSGGIGGNLQQMIQNSAMKKIIAQYGGNQMPQGQSQMSPGMPSPTQNSMTGGGMTSGPGGMFGNLGVSGGNDGWSYIGPFNG